jgi:hypothetical protein
MADSGSSHDSGAGSRILRAINAVAISPRDAKALVNSLEKKAAINLPGKSGRDHQDQVAKAIVRRYSRMSGIAGGAAALPSTIPGLGTALAMIGGGAIDTGLSIKFQVDMCMCLAECYGHDLTSEDARHLSILIALSGAEKTGGATAVKVGTKAGVALLRRYLRGAALQTIKQMFAAIGLRFTRKALEKAAPFGIGVAAGAGINYGLTRYVGSQAIAWFRIDRDDLKGDPREEPEGPPYPPCRHGDVTVGLD